MQIVAKNKAPAVSAGAVLLVRIVTRSGGLAAQEGRNIQMVIALWRRRNRRRPPMRVQPLRGGTPGIFRHRFAGRHLLGYAALGLAFGERWKRRDRGTRGARRDRRLGGLVAAAKADIGETL